MRKKIIIIMTAIVLFGGFIAGYRNINQKYPARKVETAEKGESLEFLDGVKISASGVKWLSTEEQAAIYENSGIDTSKVNYDTKIIEVNVCLKNTTEEEKEVPITYLSLETTGVGTAISRELLMGNSEQTKSEMWYYLVMVEAERQVLQRRCSTYQVQRIVWERFPNPIR